MISLSQTGPRAILLRFVDQLIRKQSGAPSWKLSEITPQLFIGGQHTPKGWKAMQDYGITTIVNMREAHHDDAAKGIAGSSYLHLPTRDNTPPRLEDLQRGAAFIKSEIARGGKVYIHCGVGVGRAPTMAAAYLISTGLSPEVALRTIKSVRPFVHLTPGQKRRLEEFRQQVAAQ